RLSSTIQGFLIWQIVIGLLQIGVLTIALWTGLSGGRRQPRVDIALLKSVWKFAAGMGGINLTGLVLTQVDKVLFSKLLSLKAFGYYSLAWTIANGLLIISGAVFNVVFPRMSAQVAAKDDESIARSYHEGTQLIAVLVIPFAVVISWFSFDVLRLWT